MKYLNSFSKLTFRFLVLTTVVFFIQQTVFCQMAKLGIVSYKQPKDWAKTEKENIVVFSEIHETTGRFCIITLYGATPGSGSPASDFAREWNSLVVTPFKGEANPKTETEAADGWTAIAGGGAIDFGGSKALALLTVYSGFGKTISVLGIVNDESYLPQLTAFVNSVDIEKESVAAAPVAAAATALQYDANGHLIIPPPTRQLTLDDLAGEWGQNDGINTRYVYRDSGTYAGADSLHFTNKMTLTAEGAYFNDFFAIQNGKKIKEDTKGSFGVNGSLFFIKEGSLKKYVIRGWLELPEMTIFVVCGPWYNDDVIPADIFSNPDQGANLDSKWVRKK